MHTGRWEIDICGCYSLIMINFRHFAHSRTTDNIWRHNTEIVCLRDVTDPFWCRHNAKSEKMVPGDNGGMGDRWLYLAEFCVQGIKPIQIDSV